MAKKRTSNYLAFLIRLWRENESAPWRFTAQRTGSSERRSFADLRKLVTFLEEQTGAPIFPVALPETLPIETPGADESTESDQD
jgi:hypothetical protein